VDVPHITIVTVIDAIYQPYVHSTTYTFDPTFRPVRGRNG
jgi:hypothetical protein